MPTPVQGRKAVRDYQGSPEWQAERDAEKAHRQKLLQPRVDARRAEEMIFAQLQSLQSDLEHNYHQSNQAFQQQYGDLHQTNPEEFNRVQAEATQQWKSLVDRSMQQYAADISRQLSQQGLPYEAEYRMGVGPDGRPKPGASMHRLEPPPQRPGAPQNALARPPRQ